MPVDEWWLGEEWMADGRMEISATPCFAVCNLRKEIASLAVVGRDKISCSVQRCILHLYVMPSRVIVASARAS